MITPKRPPKSATHRRTDDVNLRQRDAERTSDTGTDSKRSLRRCPNGNLTG